MIRTPGIILLLLLTACQFTPADQALNDVTSRARAGDAKAQSTLAAMYYHGRNVTQDYQQAFDWYSKSAEQGYADAQYNLGVAYINGHGVTQNYTKAAEWSIKAAEQGHADAQINLGLMYGRGEGVAQDDKQAYIWFSLAAANGDTDATKSRDYAATRLSPDTLRQAQIEISVLQEKIAQNQRAKNN